MNHKKSCILLLSILLTTMILSITILPGLADTRLTTDLDEDFYPAAIETSDGTIWVVWHSFRTGNSDLFFKTHNGISWSTDQQLTNNTAPDGLPSIMQANDGKIWVVWLSSRTGNYDLFFKTSSDGGSTWSSETQLTTDSNQDLGSSIFEANDGKIWVVWETKRTGNSDLFFKTSSDGGSTWSSETQLTTDADADKESSIMQAADGKIWVVWTSNRTGNDDLFFKTSSDGGSTWSADIQLTNDVGTDLSPSVMQAQDGTIWVAWQADRNIQDDIYYKIYNGSWSSENQLTWFMDLDVMPSIFQAANGTIWLVWASNKFENFDIYYKFVVPDITIINVTTSLTEVPQGNLVDIHVDVRNEGTAGATFDVTAYVNETAVGTTQWTIIPTVVGQRITFTWNTTDASLGNYVVSAEITPAIGEIDTADNTYIDGTITVGIHDVAVKNVTPSQTMAYQGYTTVDIYVEVKNEGNFSETFYVTVHYNSTSEIGTQTVTLAPNATATLTFPWDTSDVPYGNYTISAETSTILYEGDTGDNSLIDGTVTVTIPGDVYYDRTVNTLDASVISAHWYPGPPAGPLGYDPNADINGDGRTDLTDAAIINANWHKSW